METPGAKPIRERITTGSTRCKQTSQSTHPASPHKAYMDDASSTDSALGLERLLQDFGQQCKSTSP